MPLVADLVVSVEAHPRKPRKVMLQPPSMSADVALLKATQNFVYLVTPRERIRRRMLRRRVPAIVQVLRGMGAALTPLTEMTLLTMKQMPALLTGAIAAHKRLQKMIPKRDEINEMVEGGGDIGALARLDEHLLGDGREAGVLQVLALYLANHGKNCISKLALDKKLTEERAISGFGDVMADAKKFIDGVSATERAFLNAGGKL